MLVARADYGRSQPGSRGIACGSHYGPASEPKRSGARDVETAAEGSRLGRFATRWGGAFFTEPNPVVWLAQTPLLRVNPIAPSPPSTIQSDGGNGTTVTEPS